MKASIKQKFYLREAKPLLKNSYAGLEEAFVLEKDKLKTSFLPYLERACENITYNQIENQLPPVGHLVFHLIRSDILQKKYVYHVTYYDEDFYYGTGYRIGEFDVSFFYRQLEDIKAALTKRASKYIRKISTWDIERFMLEAMDGMHQYVISFLAYCLKDAKKSKAFSSFQRAARFEIAIGEYDEPCLVLYQENMAKNQLHMLKALKKNKHHMGSDYRNIILEQMCYEKLQSYYADFSDGRLEHAQVQLARLIGASFQHANLRNVKFHCCMLQEADFTNADLTGAHFNYCLFYQGKDPINEQRKPGYLPVSMKGCVLEETSFQYAVLNGTGFEEANLVSCDFTGASLYGCTFTKEQLTRLTLTQEQQEQIILIQ